VGQRLASEATPPPPAIPESEPRPKAFAAVAAAQAMLDPQEAHSVLEQAAKAKLEADRNAISWNRRDAAKLLHIDYAVLIYKIKKPGLKRPTAG